MGEGIRTCRRASIHITVDLVLKGLDISCKFSIHVECERERKRGKKMSQNQREKEKKESEKRS